MDILGIRNSIRALKRNLTKLKNKESDKAKRLRDKTEKKIAKQIALLETCGVPIAIKKKKRIGDHSSYVKYIKSPEWSERRKIYFESHKKRCRSCGTPNRINLHHGTYSNLFKEKDEDLVPLCGTCHSCLHTLQDVYRITVEEATFIWLWASKGMQIKKLKAKKLKTLLVEVNQSHNNDGLSIGEKLKKIICY